MTLTEFLHARIDEDLARAMVAADVEGAAELLAALPEALFEGLRVAFPKRVVADAQTKRQIVDFHTGEHQCAGRRLEWTGFRANEYVELDFGCLTLGLLTLPYADHPDYDPGWRP